MKIKHSYPAHQFAKRRGVSGLVINLLVLVFLATSCSLSPPTNLPVPSSPESLANGNLVSSDPTALSQQTEPILAFTARRESASFNIYTISTNDVEWTRVTSSTLNDEAPSWSPDGEWLAFYRGEGTTFDIYKARVDDGTEVRLTNTTDNLFPDWSPDGQTIAFERGFDIWVMKSDGSQQKRLTKGWRPKWSPNGEYISYQSSFMGDDGALAIKAIRADGSGQARVTDNLHTVDASLSDRAGAGYSWSPDSTRIVFSWISNENEELYIADVGGKNLVRLTNDPARDTGPAWSPDGRRIAFLSNRGGGEGDCNLYTIAVDGTDVRKLTTSPVGCGSTSWSPDGRYLTFAREAGIGIIEADGTNERTLTKMADYANGPVWSPK